MSGSREGSFGSMKIDLHCHSKYSNVATLWIMKRLNCPESYTEPLHLYNRQLSMGMKAVTITDHDTIDGALEIAHLPNAFIGCEYTTHFPDRCKVHILVYRQTEAQHKDLMQARMNIYDLVTYCRENNLPTICAHPFFWVNDRLQPEHIEQLILLFKNWELNGDIAPYMNQAVQTLAESLTPADIERLAAKHGYEPLDPEPWRKNFTCGTDCHTGLNLGTAWTRVPQARNLDEFWQGLYNGQGSILCPSDIRPERFARNAYSIFYQYYKSKVSIEKYVNKDVFLSFMERALIYRHEDAPQGVPAWYHMFLSRRRAARDTAGKLGQHSLFQMARLEAEKIIHDDPQLMAIIREDNTHGAGMDDKWFEFANQVSNKMLVHFGTQLVDRFLSARLFDIFHTLGSAGALYALLSPYFIAFSLHRQQATWSRKVLAHFDAEGVLEETQPTHKRVAHFTDTFKEVNGVARTLQQQLAVGRDLGKDYRIVTCFADSTPFEPGVKQFDPVGVHEVPEYPELKLLVPPFMQMLKYCYDEGITHIHAATPGPVGLAALGVARILQLPISGTYHTAIPEYGKALTGDSYVEDVLWKGVSWFYEQMDTIFVPSKATAQILIEHGMTEEKMQVYPRGIDIDRFHPSKQSNILSERFGIQDGLPNMLFVGRVSKEKNLHLLAVAYRALLERGIQARLIVCGDGPYRKEMEGLLEETPALFTGYLKGEELPALYASSGFLVFPSTTDTFGNVVLEAQASGIPVIVTDEGGPQENLLPGETGLIVKGNEVEPLVEAMAQLCQDPARVKAMGAAGRDYMSRRGFREAFAKLYGMYVSEDPEEQRADDLGNLMQAMTNVQALAS